MATFALSSSAVVSIGSVEVDAVLSEDASLPVEITKHPVEKGSKITDHVRPEPETLSLECVVSNTAISEDMARRFGAQPLGAEGRAEKAIADLRRMREQGEIVTVVTRLRTYTSMAIKSLRIPRDAKSGDAIRFSISFEQVREVASQTVQLRTVEPKGKGLVDAGGQVTEPTKEPEPRGGTLWKLKQAAKRKLQGG